ncbi:MAG: hypothetical protein GY842_27945 [bacterium]|nr:hypothetical protein [bacterium]
MTAHRSSDMTDSGAAVGTSTVTLLRQIQSDAVDPRSISVADRRQLVAFLLGDGYSTAEMSQILKVGDRTIERDKKAIRESNALARDPRLVEQMMGRLVGEAELAVQRIRKAVRDKDTSKALRVDAEHRCYLIISDLVGAMQRLGYLPTAAQKVEADLTHHLGEVPDLAMLQGEVRRLRQICPVDGENAPDTIRQLSLLEQQITQADLASRVEVISSTLNDRGVTHHESE